MSLNAEEILNFSPLAFRIGHPPTEDFWSAISKADVEDVPESVCAAGLPILGIEQNNENCLQFEIDGSDCYRLGVFDFSLAEAFGVHGFYDSSRGGFKDDDGQSIFPFSAPKCFNVAERYFSGWYDSDNNIDPEIGLSYSYAQDTDGNFTPPGGYFEQLSIGYGDLKRNHPYGNQSPYGDEKLNDSFVGFGDPLFHHIYAKKVETIGSSDQQGVVFNDLEYAYFDSVSINDNQSPLIEITQDKIIFHLDTAPDSSDKHEVTFHTCKTCVKGLPIDYYNAVDSEDDYDGEHTRPEGTLESEEYDRLAPEGGCAHCADELFSAYVTLNGSDFESSNLIGYYSS